MLKSEAKKGDFAKIWQKLGGGGARAPQPPWLRRPCEVRRSGQVAAFVVCAVFSLSF